MPHITPNLNGNTPDDMQRDLYDTIVALTKAREALAWLRANTCHGRNYTDQEGRRSDLHQINQLIAQIETFQRTWVEDAARICNEADAR